MLLCHRGQLLRFCGDLARREGELVSVFLRNRLRFLANEAAQALGAATTYQGAEILHLRDGTTLGFGGVAGLTQASFV